MSAGGAWIDLPRGGEGWRVGRTRYLPAEDGLYESLLYLANGPQGLRATVDFGNTRGRPGFFSRTLYGRGLTTPRQLVNTLNPSYLDIRLDGIALPLEAASSSTFHQELDLRHAYVELQSSVRHRDAESRVRIDRVLPAGKDCLITIVSLWAARECHVAIQVGCSFGHGNSDLAGRQDDVRIRHLELAHRFEDGELSGAICINRSDRRLAGVCTRVLRDAGLIAAASRCLPGGLLAREITGMVPAGPSQLVLVSHYAEEDGGPGRCSALAERLAALSRGCDAVRLIREHLAHWEACWRDAPLIESDAELTLGSRYGAFQLLQLVDARPGAYNVPARGLSSEYHSGHFFFNSEFFVTPYFAYADPAQAKAMLRHRLERLPRAKAFATSCGLRGARYPEESDDLGDPAAPREIKDIFSGTSIWEWSGVEVVHTSADVLHALSRYLSVTEDRAFLITECAPLLVECSEYLSSVLVWDPSVTGYTARRVMGFDEYHFHVDHHFATNWLCRWGLSWVLREIEEDPALSSACERYIGMLAQDWPSARARWADVAARTYLPDADESGVYPVFADYFALPDQTKVADAPVVHSNVPEEDAARADRMEPFQTRLTKQADIVFLMTLFPGEFTDAEVAANLRFYEPRTVHGSSLSMAAHTAAALRVNDDALAVKLLRASLRYNLDYEPRTDYENGVHIAAYAGAFLVLVEDILGLRLGHCAACGLQQIAALHPRVPQAIRRFEVTLTVLGRRIRFQWKDGALAMTHSGGDGQALHYSLAGIERVLPRGSTHHWPAGAHKPTPSPQPA